MLIEKDDIFVYNLNTDVSEAVDLSGNTALLVSLFKEYTEWQQQMPEVTDEPATYDNGTLVTAPRNKGKPRYKDIWSFFLPMTDNPNAREGKKVNVLEASTQEVGRGDTYQAHVLARYADSSNKPVLIDSQPKITWSLISNIGGAVDQNGLFTAGSTDGYLILKAQSDKQLVSVEKHDSFEDVCSYQLIKVGL